MTSLPREGRTAKVLPGLEPAILGDEPIWGRVPHGGTSEGVPGTRRWPCLWNWRAAGS